MKANVLILRTQGVKTVMVCGHEDERHETPANGVKAASVVSFFLIYIQWKGTYVLAWR